MDFFCVCENHNYVTLYMYTFKTKLGTFLVVQWLRLCASTAGGTGSIPDWELN